MEPFVLVLMIVGGSPHALPFRSESACVQWSELFNMDPSPQWLGRCMPEREFRATYPHMPLQMGS